MSEGNTITNYLNNMKVLNLLYHKIGNNNFKENKSRKVGAKSFLGEFFSLQSSRKIVLSKWPKFRLYFQHVLFARVIENAPLRINTWKKFVKLPPSGFT